MTLGNKEKVKLSIPDKPPLHLFKDGHQALLARHERVLGREAPERALRFESLRPNKRYLAW